MDQNSLSQYLQKMQNGERLSDQEIANFQLIFNKLDPNQSSQISNQKYQNQTPEEQQQRSSIPKQNKPFLDVKYSVKKRVKNIEIRLLDQEKITEQDRDMAIKILLVGQTGVGKTTLINSMANYLYQTSISDSHRYQLIYDYENVSSQGHSQTQAVSEYLVKSPFFSRPFLFIDTPGFGDTGGIKADQEHQKKVAQYLTNTINELSAIAFVIKASSNRLDSYQRYVMDEVLNHFGKDASKNIFMLFTFADGGDCNALEQVKEHKIPFSDFFKINNSAIFPKDHAYSKYDQQDKFTQMFWDLSYQGIQSFLQAARHADTISLNSTREVLKTRDLLKSYLMELQADIKLGICHQQSLQSKYQQFQDNKKKIMENKDFTYFESEGYKERKNVDHPTTVCHNCNFNCHDKCAYEDNDDKAHCVAMDSNGNCKVCSGRCHWRNHTNTKWLWEAHTRTITKTYYAKKQNYDQAMSAEQRFQAELKKIEVEYTRQQKKVKALINETRQCIDLLNGLALKPTNTGFADYIEVLIKREEDKQENGWKERIDELRKIRDQNRIEQNIISNDKDLLGLNLVEISQNLKDQKQINGQSLKNQKNCNIF